MGMQMQAANSNAEFDVFRDQPRSESRTGRGGRKPYDLVWAKDITAESTSKSYLIDGFLGREEVSIWYGAPECGKSTAKIDAACHVATGRAWCGREVTRGAVLYVAAERGQLVMRRVLAWRLDQETDDIPLAVINDAVDLRSGRVDAERIIEAAKAAEKQAKQRVVWVIFDTLNRVLAGGDENNPKDMGALIMAVDHVQRETKAHCSLIHHMPLNGDRMRGHTSLLGAADVTVRIEKQVKVVTVRVDKANDLADDERPQHSFGFKSITLLEDPLRTASVLVPVGQPVASAMRTTPKAKMAAGSKIALRALRDAILDTGELNATPRCPPNIKSVSDAVWREYAYRAGITSGKTLRAKQIAFQNATAALVAANIIGSWDNQYWLVREDLIGAG
jgi:hypothetical protein